MLWIWRWGWWWLKYQGSRQVPTFSLKVNLLNLATLGWEKGQRAENIASMYYFEHESKLHWQNLDDRTKKWQKLDGDNADYPHPHMPLLIQPPNGKEQYPLDIIQCTTNVSYYLRCGWSLFYCNCSTGSCNRAGEHIRRCSTIAVQLNKNQKKIKMTS